MLPAGNICVLFKPRVREIRELYVKLIYNGQIEMAIDGVRKRSANLGVRGTWVAGFTHPEASVGGNGKTLIDE